MAVGSVTIDLLMRTGSFETDTARAQRKFEGFSQSVSRNASLVSHALSGLSFFGGVGKGLVLADEYSQMASRLKIATDSTAEYIPVQNRLSESAKITYRSLSEAQEGFLSFSGGMKALGYTVNDVLNVTDSLSFAFTANGARADQARNAQDALAKAFAKGRIDANAWVSILQAA